MTPLLESPNLNEEGDSLREEFRLARHFLWEGNYAQAELHLRRYWQLGGQASQSQKLFEMIAKGYGVLPTFRLSENTTTTTDLVQPQYLLIKAWGHGFWSDVHHVLGQLLLAELLHKVPVVHWGNNSLFRENDDARSNAYTLYFELPTGTRIEDLPQDISVYPAKWNRSNLYENDLNKMTGLHSRISAQSMFGRSEQLLVSDFYTPIKTLIPWIGSGSKYFGLEEAAIYRLLFSKYLKVTPPINSEVDAFYERHMVGKYWVAVHVRGSDKVVESVDLDRTNARYAGYVDRIVSLNPDIGIFLLTDSAEIRNEYQQRYGNRLLTTDATRSTSQYGVHFSGHSGFQIGREVLTDVLLATRCDYFVGNQESNVSLAISSMKRWESGFSFMLGDFDTRSVDNFLLHEHPSEPTLHCRLCGAPTRRLFNKTVLGTHAVGYHQCTGCDALQTDHPHWLQEAYAHKAEMYDTGKASRTLVNFLALPKLLEFLQIQPGDRALDFGGGTGLFGRLMRDMGYNFYTHDKYGNSEFMGAFSCNDALPRCKLVTIFEVAEHFADPMAEWQKILACDPDWVIGSTGIYSGQDASWPYLSADSGQHIFFYSANAIAYLALMSGRFAYIIGMYFLISRTALDDKTLQKIEDWNAQPYEGCKNTFDKWIRAPYNKATEDSATAVAVNALHQTKKRIAVDGMFFRFATGIARVWKTLLSHWSSTLLADQIVIIDRGKTAPRLPGYIYVDVPHYDYAQVDQDRILLQEICDRENVGLFISTYYTTPLSTPSALLVLDMIPEVLAYDLSHAQWAGKRNAIEYASRYISISHSTESDLIKFYPQISKADCFVSYCGCDFRPAPSTQLASFLSRYEIQKPYFLISGERDGPKNADLFFRAFAEFGDSRCNFAIVCTNANTPLNARHAEMAGNATVHLVVLNDAELQCAYSGALALVYPSRYEGFGLPVLEAMACECPVITCRNSSIPEVGGDAPIYVDPDSVDEMHAALLAVQISNTRAQMIYKGIKQATQFSWSRMSSEIGNLLAKWAVQLASRNVK